MNIAAEGIETEVIEEGAAGLTIKGKAKKTEEFVDKRVRKALTKEEFDSFREETKEDPFTLICYALSMFVLMSCLFLAE